MKCILSGVKLKGLLSFKTLVAKATSLTFGLASGMKDCPALVGLGVYSTCSFCLGQV